VSIKAAVSEPAPGAGFDEQLVMDAAAMSRISRLI
jgi:hypothetical protein